MRCFAPIIIEEETMKITEVAAALGGHIACGRDRAEITVDYGFSADLLSDVLTLEKEKILLVTGLCSLQTIRTAEMAEIDCIVIARGKKVSPSMVELADRAGVILVECDYSVFRPSGILFDAGLKPIY